MHNISKCFIVVFLSLLNIRPNELNDFDHILQPFFIRPRLQEVTLLNATEKILRSRHHRTGQCFPDVPVRFATLVRRSTNPTVLMHRKQIRPFGWLQQGHLGDNVQYIGQRFERQLIAIVAFPKLPNDREARWQ
uniref:Putative secreted protein n=1 Tax=Anopheles marajoara TaxID=58244 RepID=A0A2M4C725_9DIPT